MSKERLEEIKEQVEISNTHDDNPNGYWYKNIWWLIEQAERAEKNAQDLEEENKTLQQSYKTNTNAGLKYWEIAKKTGQQNKRLREAIEKAIVMISVSTGTITKPKEIALYDAWEIKNTLLEALEESE